MGRALNHLSSEATQQTNATGVTDPILEINPDDGTLLRFLNQVSIGAAEGIPIIADLRDSGDAALPVGTDLVLEAKRPTDDTRVAVSVLEDNIAAWNALTTAEQRNEENIDSVKVELKGSSVNIRDVDTFYVSLNSSTAIDWANSELYFYRGGVQEEALEG